MTFGLRIGGTRPQVVLISRSEFSQLRRLKPFTRAAIVANTTPCPVVAGRVLQMPAPAARVAR